jgi:hypothetical protein
MQMTLARWAHRPSTDTWQRWSRSCCVRTGQHNWYGVRKSHTGLLRYLDSEVSARLSHRMQVILHLWSVLVFDRCKTHTTMWGVDLPIGRIRWMMMHPGLHGT